MKAALSRSLLVLFALQLLLSTFCISTASAMRAPMMDQSQHCQNMMPAPMVQPAGSDFLHNNMANHHHACSHCDAPDLGFSTQAPEIPDLQLLTCVLTLIPETVTTLAFNRIHPLDADAPPHSPSLLYTTTRRILI